MSRIMMQRKDKPKPQQPPLKTLWRAAIDDHPIGLAWSPDGKLLAYAANDRDPATVEVILHNVETGETRRPMMRSPSSVWSR